MMMKIKLIVSSCKAYYNAATIAETVGKSKCDELGQRCNSKN